jgi:RHS repeat-associated protein
MIFHDFIHHPSWPSRRLALAFLLLFSAFFPFALRADPDRAVKVYIEGTLNGDYGEIVLGGGGAAGNQGVFIGDASLLPDKVYQLTLTGQFESATVNLVAAGDYRVFINGSERKRLQISGDSGSVITEIYDVELRQSGAGAPAGVSSGLSVGDIRWGVSLGRTYNGTQAGSLVVTSETLDASLFNRGILSYYGIKNQTGVLRDADGIRQIITPEVFVDITDCDGGFCINFYPLNARGSLTNAFYDILPGVPWFVSHKIHRDSDNDIKVTIAYNEDDDGMLTHAIETSPGHWGKSLAGGVVQEERVPYADPAFDADTSAEDITLFDGGDVIAGGTADVARETRRIYKAFPWNKTPGYPQSRELIKIIQDPDGAALATEYEYYSDETQSGSYGRLQWVKYPDGNWVKYDYYESGSRRGQVFHEYRPWLDSPASPELAATGNGHVITYDYADDWDGAGRLVAGRVETVNGVTVAGQTATHTLPSQKVNGLKVWIWETQTQTGGAHTLASRAGMFRAGQDEAQEKYNELPWFVENADGTKEVHAHAYGDYTVSGDNYDFTPAGAGTYLQTVTLRGIKPAAGEAGEITLVPGKSAKTVRILKNGRIYREIVYVYTSEDAFSEAGSTVYDYDDSGRLISRKSGNGVEYQAEWIDGFKTWERTGSGVEYYYSPDPVQRVAVMAKAEAPDYEFTGGGFSAQNQIVTHYTYNAAGNITQKTITGGALSLQETKAYDLAGRTTQTTDVNGLVATRSYATDNRTVTITLPDGGTQIYERHRDGRTKSVTGSARFAEYMSYTVDAASGLGTTTVHHGTAGSGAWRAATLDWTGREVSAEQPTPVSGVTVGTHHYYNDKGQRIKTTRPGFAPVLYEYDVTGALLRTGLKIASGPSDALAPASADRIAEYASGFVQLSGEDGWWWSEEVYIYPKTGNAAGAPVRQSHALTRLGGFAAGVTAERRVTDIHGNTVTSRTEVSPADRLVYQVLESPASDKPAGTTWYNGLLVETQDFQGDRVRHEHDGLGRAIKTIYQRRQAVRTVYHEGKNLVASATFEDGAFIAGYGYDTAGRLSHIIDAHNRNTLLEYNQRGQLLTRWGDGASPVSYEYGATFGRLLKQTTYRNITGNTKPSGDGDNTTFEYYGDLAVVKKRKDHNNNALFYNYDAAGRLVSTVNARGQVLAHTYDLQTGELLTTEGASSGDVGYTYTRFGALAGVTDATGARTFDYDPDTLALLSENLPAYFGTSAGQNRVIGYEYSTGGSGGGSGDENIKGRLTAWGLGRSGNIHADQKNAYDYTADGRLDKITADASGFARRVFSFGYHAQQPGLITGITEIGPEPADGTGYTVTRDYDPRWDVPVSVGTGYGSTGVPVSHFEYQYDERGLRTSAEQNGSAFADYGGNGVTHWDFEYTSRGELKRAEQFLGAAGDISSPLPGRCYNFTYDSIGNRVKAGNSGDPDTDEVYTSNALNQITGKENNTVHVSGLGLEGMAVKSTAPLAAEAGVQGRFWSVEAGTANTNGPAKETVPLWFGKAGAGPNGTDLLASAERTIFQPKAFEQMGYDDDGNLTADGVWNYTYDENNRLVAMQTRSDNGVLGVMIGLGGTPQPRSVTFAYDYMGRRVSKKTFIFDPTSNPLVPAWIEEKETRFIWNGWTLVAEVDASDTTQIARHFHWTAGGAGGLLMIQDNDANEETGGTYFPGYDGNGNVSVLLKSGIVAGTMTVAAKYEYSPFGELLRREGPYAKRNPFIWSTEYTDHETGLVYYGYLYYAPRFGRFINKTPDTGVGGGAITINAEYESAAFAELVERESAYTNRNPIIIGPDQSTGKESSSSDYYSLSPLRKMDMSWLYGFCSGGECECRTGGACSGEKKCAGTGTCPCGPNCGHQAAGYGMWDTMDNGGGNGSSVSIQTDGGITGKVILGEMTVLNYQTEPGGGWYDWETNALLWNNLGLAPGGELATYNNPVMYTGYESHTDALFDFGTRYHGISYETKDEYGAFIFENSSGKWDMIALQLTKSGGAWPIYDFSELADMASKYNSTIFIHTHGAPHSTMPDLYENFSTIDLRQQIEIFQDWSGPKLDYYLFTPNKQMLFMPWSGNYPDQGDGTVGGTYIIKQ